MNRRLGETLELESYDLRSARVSVECRLAPGLPPALGDPDRLRQVFTNLLLNATEALRGGARPGTLVVTTREDEAAGRLVVTVADDGPGIAAEHLARIFEPFFTTEGDGRRTGLGLANCRQIVGSHQGRIAAESQPGAGASFTVELPMVRAAAGRPPEPPVARERGMPRGVEVLLVEDEQVVGDLLAEYLALDGHRVDRAANGREALALVRARRYGLIISDVRMPDVDGPTLYHELRAIDPDLTRHMVFMTGDVMSPDTRRFLDETGLLYLEKPFGIAEFQAVIRRVLGQGDPPGRADQGA